MIEGQEYAEFEIMKNGKFSDWCFGVCRPGIDLNDGKSFHFRDDTWMMYQDNNPSWSLCCNSNRGNFVDWSIDRELNAGDRVGLLLDLDNGRTLTLYLDGKPCGTIAEGLTGPLHWCIVSVFAGKELEVLLNGKQIAGSPFAVEVKRLSSIKYVFRSVETGEFALSEGDTVATKTENASWRGAIADGQFIDGGAGADAAAAPMIEGQEYAEFEIVKGSGGWCFGVCRPEINLNNAASKDFCNRVQTGTTRDRVGLLLDLDNGGTLTLYLDGKPCGTIAEGLAGPLHWCIASCFRGKVVRIYAGLGIPPQ
eukprot:gene32920-biopygen25639